jgi:hypothetical protein
VKKQLMPPPTDEDDGGVMEALTNWNRGAHQSQTVVDRFSRIQQDNTLKRHNASFLKRLSGASEGQESSAQQQPGQGSSAQQQSADDATGAEKPTAPIQNPVQQQQQRRLSREQMAAAAEAFWTVDADANAVLDREEWKQLMAITGSDKEADVSLDDAFDRADLDGDGVVDWQEWLAASEASRLNVGGMTLSQQPPRDDADEDGHAQSALRASPPLSQEPPRNDADTDGHAQSVSRASPAHSNHKAKDNALTVGSHQRRRHRHRRHRSAHDASPGKHHSSGRDEPSGGTASNVSVRRGNKQEPARSSSRGRSSASGLRKTHSSETEPRREARPHSRQHRRSASGLSKTHTSEAASESEPSRGERKKLAV